MKVHLKPLERDHKIDVWNDTKLRSGDKWKAEIDKALAKARVGILLVSADFLASDFIHNDELPPLLDAAKKEGLVILCIIVGHTGSFSKSAMGAYQAINDPSLPLDNMLKGQADQIFAQLYNRVHEIFFPAPQKEKKNTPPARKTRAASSTEAPQKAPIAKTTTTHRKSAALRSQAGNSALLVLNTGYWQVVAIKEATLADEIDLVISKPDPSQRAFLNSLRNNADLESFVYRSQLYLCKRTQIQAKNLGSQESWYLHIIPQPMNRQAEITYVSLTPSMQAEARARLLLLNTPLPRENNIFFGNHNSNINARFEQSPLPTLYKLLGKQVNQFKIAAYLICTWYLQINNIVEHILKLEFSIRGSHLTVKFEGIRSKQYQSEEPPTIHVEGTCSLSQGVTEESLMLASYMPYR